MRLTINIDPVYCKVVESEEGVSLRVSLLASSLPKRFLQEFPTYATIGIDKVQIDVWEDETNMAFVRHDGMVTCWRHYKNQGDQPSLEIPS